MHLHISDRSSTDPTLVAHVRCRTCGRKLPGAPWIMPWHTLTFCTAACEQAFAGEDCDAPF